MSALRKTVCYLLCITLFWTTVMPAAAQTPNKLAALKKSYPQARIIHTTAEQYPQLALQLAQSGYRSADAQLALGVGSAPAAAPVSSGFSDSERPAGDCEDPVQTQSSGSMDLSVNLSHGDGSGSSTGSSWGGGSEDAAVVFVVIGTVVLVVWTLYALSYLVDLALGRETCGAWTDLGLTSTWVSGGGEASAWFGGARLLSGVRYEATHVGLSGELGQSRIRLPEEGLDVYGHYWLLGPLLRWRTGGAQSNPHYLQLEFLAGSTSNSEVGYIAQARVGLSFGVDRRLRWGLNLGALKIKLSETESLVGELSHYHFLTGLELGYRF